MSAETEAKANEAPQTRPASAFSRVWSRSLPVLLNWFRTAPCSIILTLIIMLVGITAHLSHGRCNSSARHRDDSCVESFDWHDDQCCPHDGDHRWPS